MSPTLMSHLLPIEVRSSRCGKVTPDKIFEAASTCASDSDSTLGVLRTISSSTCAAVGFGEGIRDVARTRWVDAERLCAVSFPPWDGKMFQLERVLRPVVDRRRCQIELVRNVVSDTRLVVKRFPRDRLCESPAAFRMHYPGDTEDPWQEILLAQQLGSVASTRVKGVCPCYGAFTDERGDVLLASEWVPGGDLFDLASNLGPVGPEREAQALPILKSLLEAVTGLHKLGIAHNDVSAENALLRCGQDGQMEVVLLDFAMAVSGADLSAVHGVRGKLMYRAPETVAYDAVYDARAADLFACGVVGYALAIGNYPWMSTVPGACKAFEYARANGIPRFFQKRYVSQHGQQKVSVAKALSQRYQAILEVLLDMDPRNRHGALDLFD